MKVAQLLENSRGEQVMLFADYLQSSRFVRKKDINSLQRIGDVLFKNGFTLYTNTIRFSKDTEGGPGMGWSILMPHSRASMNGVSFMFTTWDEEKQGLAVGRDFFTFAELDAFGLDGCMRKTKSKASVL